MGELSLQARNDAQSGTIKTLFDENEALKDRVAALTEEIELLRGRAPRDYILTRAAEWARLFREVRGYLKTCHQKHGTDWSGRQHAMNALDKAASDLEANCLQKGD